jgi:hypothetical protein
MDMNSIAGHLAMRSAANASQQIRRHRRGLPKLPKPLQQFMTPISLQRFAPAG